MDTTGNPRRWPTREEIGSKSVMTMSISHCRADLDNLEMLRLILRAAKILFARVRRMRT